MFEEIGLSLPSEFFVPIFNTLIDIPLAVQAGSAAVVDIRQSAKLLGSGKTVGAGVPGQWYSTSAPGSAGVFNKIAYHILKSAALGKMTELAGLGESSTPIGTSICIAQGNVGEAGGW
jgi:hypothetical protein